MRQGPENEGRVRHVKDLGGRWKTGKETTGEEESGTRYKSPREGRWIPGSGTSEVGLVLLELHHKVMNVDELSPGRESSELGLREHPVEAMIELDQLGQSSLVRESHGRIRLWAGAEDDIRNQARAHPELWACW